MKNFSSLVIIFLAFFLPSNAFSSELHIFLKANKCADCDLSFSDLNYSSFKNCDLSGANLSYFNAARSSFFNCSFRGTKLIRSNFSHANLTSSDFTGAVFDNTVFVGTIVTDSIFDYDTVPSSIIKNSVDFPIHNLPRKRIYTLISTTSPHTHSRFYLGLLKQLKQLSPNDPSVSILMAHYFYRYQLDYDSMISSLENASSQYIALNENTKSEQINELIKTARFQLQNSSSSETPGAKGNGLGISAVKSIGDFLTNLLPTLTSMSTLLR